MDSNKKYQVLVHGKNFEVDQNFIDHCGHLKVICDDDNFSSDSIQINATQVTPEIFSEILRYFELQGGKPVASKKLVSHKREDNMRPEELRFLQSYDVRPGDNLSKLEKAATFLQIEPLQCLISLAIATEIYFDGTHESYEEMKRRLDINHDLGVEEEQMYRSKYVWLAQYDQETVKDQFSQMEISK